MTVAAPSLPPADEFTECFGERLADVLDTNSWRAGSDLLAEYDRINREVAEAHAVESAVAIRIRREVLPRIQWTDGLSEANWYTDVTTADIELTHAGLLFNGKVTACDGTHQMHDSLAVTIHQIGVCLVTYRGDQRSWGTRLFRRDLRQGHTDPAAEALALLEARGRRGALNHPDGDDGLSELARRAVMSYAEASLLLREARTPWRLGHGSPAPYQLLAGAGYPDVAILAMRTLRELIATEKWVYVSSEPADRLLLTIGQSLRPLEYAVVRTLDEHYSRFLDRIEFSRRVSVDDRWDGVSSRPEKWVQNFRDECLSQVVVGVYRASHLAPPQVFYCHRKHHALAARIALADSVLMPDRGFPLLIDLADRGCKSVYGGNSLQDLADAAHARLGPPFRYQSERVCRPG